MLIYKGNGFIVKVPARDLTDEEVKQYGEEKLIKSGLYEKPKGKRKKEGDK